MALNLQMVPPLFFPVWMRPMVSVVLPVASRTMLNLA
jgi:hypothetical protein